MPYPEQLGNRVKALRQARGWTQDQLAQAAGLSRTGVSAIEGQRLVPSVAAAMALARALDCSVEEMFLSPRADNTLPAWAWQPAALPCSYWEAEVARRRLRYPIEASSSSTLLHDGVAGSHRAAPARFDTSPKLVVACCDPAAGLLIAEYERQSDFRMLVLTRSSGQALELLTKGLVHVAGVHLARVGERRGNDSAIRQLRLPHDLQLLHVAHWQEGIAGASGTALKSVHQAAGGNLRWIGRIAGAGARRCQDELLAGRPAPRRTARDHRGVVEAIKSGWADVGVCVRLACEEGQLAFLPVWQEHYDLCFRADEADDPRLVALIRVVRSAEYRRLLSALPGYRPQNLGEVEDVPTQE